MHGALDRALALYAQEPQRFAELVQRGMLVGGAMRGWGAATTELLPQVQNTGLGCRGLPADGW